MTYPFPYGGITITVERPSYDRFNDVSGYTYFTIENAVDFPSGTSEASPNVGVTDRRTLLVPSHSDVRATDRVVLHDAGSSTPPALGSPERRAATYQVDGKPKDWVHAMTGWSPGMTLDLVRIT